MRRITLLVLFLPILAFAQINKNGDFQIWTRSFFNYDFAKKWDCQIIAEARWGDNASKLYFTYLQGQLLYAPTSWIYFGPGYRQIWKRFPLSSHHWKPLYSPLAEVTFVIHLSGWEIRDRNRVQYLIFEQNPSHWLYRNRLRVIFPKSWLHMTPFADDEVFWRESMGVNQNRTSLGFLIEFSHSVAGEAFYMLRWIKSPNWVHQNVMNATLSFSF